MAAWLASSTAAASGLAAAWTAVEMSRQAVESSRRRMDVLEGPASLLARRRSRVLNRLDVHRRAGSARLPHPNLASSPRKRGPRLFLSLNELGSPAHEHRAPTSLKNLGPRFRGDDGIYLVTT